MGILFICLLGTLFTSLTYICCKLKLKKVLLFSVLTNPYTIFVSGEDSIWQATLRSKANFRRKWKKTVCANSHFFFYCFCLVCFFSLYITTLRIIYQLLSETIFSQQYRVPASWEGGRETSKRENSEEIRTG